MLPGIGGGLLLHSPLLVNLEQTKGYIRIVHFELEISTVGSDFGNDPFSGPFQIFDTSFVLGGQCLCYGCSF